ncbi:hypothetical protein AB0K15_13590 [Amycolatopsis sp. NPDC049253]|uniref:hypothetical protein n=1 Tax=Amycolatopsis sp. NPDC049253 TaxID=3155274 RepID=UPI0034498227
MLLGDRRPCPAANPSVDPDELPVLAAETGSNTDKPGRHVDERLRSVIARDVASVEARYSPPEQIRDFALAPEPFSVESGELTPTLKIRRNVVARRHAVLVDALYPTP